MQKSQTNRTMQSWKGILLICIITVFIFPAMNNPRPVAAASSAFCQEQNCLFLPVLAQPASTKLDLVLKGIEVTQAIQDDLNSVPLVDGRSTMLRIYALVNGSSAPLKGIKISVTATRDETVLETAVQNLTATIPLTVSHSDYSSSINIPLPASWLSGSINLKVSIDADNTVTEAEEGNNSITQRLVFHQVPQLRILVVPVRYTHTPNGHAYEAPTQDTLSDWINRTYPVSKVQISWHAPYAFQGDLTKAGDFSTLLSEITALKMSEGMADDVVYYGLVPTEDTQTTWFYGGIAGLGWIGIRAAIGLDIPGNSSQVAAHELGHNLGLSHSPCGVEGDPNYPYSSGSIGQYGLDVLTGRVYGPASSKDVMSYCNPKWVSDYTYRSLFNTQSQVLLPKSSQAEAALALSRNLLVRAQISEQGARLLPSYVVTGKAVQAQSTGEYEVQALDAQGAVIARSAATVYQAEEEGLTLRGIQVTLSLPDQPAALVRLVKDGQVLAEQALADQDLAEQVLLNETGRQTSRRTAHLSADGASLSWAAADQPVMLRYSTDGGQTWSTLGVDVKGGKTNIPANLRKAGVRFDVVVAGDWK